MPLTPINIGSSPNDGTGETLRSGGAKINTNYTFTVTTDTAQTISGAKTFTSLVIGNAFRSVISNTLIGAFTRVSDWTGGAANNDLAIGSYEPTMRFYTNNSVTERMRIAADGNVGIGTTAIPGKLTIRRDGGAALTLQGVSSSAGTAVNSIDFQNLFSSNADGTAVARIAVETESNVDGGAIIFSTSNSGNSPIARMRIAANGVISMNTTANAAYNMTLRVEGGIETHSNQFNMAAASGATDFEWVLRVGSRQLFYVSNATVVANLSAAGVWTNASDARHKENIRPVPYGLNEVLKLKPRAYNMRNDKTEQIGFIAQEVEPVLPELVESVHNDVTGEDRYTLSYSQMSAVLVKSIQELKAELEALKVQLASAKECKCE